MEEDFVTCIKELKYLIVLVIIDINIKCGNSLISRYALDVDLSQALKKTKITIGSYKQAVQNYRHASSKEQKRDMENFITSIMLAFSVYGFSQTEKEKDSVVETSINVLDEIVITKKKVLYTQKSDRLVRYL